MNKEILEVNISDIIVDDWLRDPLVDVKSEGDYAERSEQNEEELIQSIRDHSLFNPIGISDDYRLVFGKRNLMLIRDVLGSLMVSARIVDIKSILLGEVTASSIRNSYQTSERVGIVNAMRGFKNNCSQKSERIARGDFDITLEQACNLVGFSLEDFSRAERIVKHGIKDVIQGVDIGLLKLSAGATLVEANRNDQKWIFRTQKAKWDLSEKAIRKRAVRLGCVPNKSDQPVATSVLARNSVTVGDCRELIPALPDRSINLCVTSPPYAEQRKKFYRSVPENKYTEFTLEWMTALKSKLTENGSVLINIDAHVKDGVVSDYVLKMQLGLREAGWNPHRTQIWHKGGMPSGRPDWPRHSYEEVLWLSRSKNPFCDTRAAGTATGNALVTDRARVSDVIRIDVANNENGVDHPARFPVRLAKRLIKTFCPKGGTVLDPFSGSGSSLIAAKKQKCDYYGFEIMPKYVELSRSRINKARVDVPVTFVDAVDEGLSQSRSCDTDAA